jgi:hypothetical protein
MAGCSEQEKENYLAPYVAENFIVRCENVCLFNTTPTHGGNVVSLGNSISVTTDMKPRVTLPLRSKQHDVKSEFKLKDLEIHSIR